MNRIKDFFYNKNDIIIVILILVAAAFLIYNRIGIIMDYPEKLADSQATKQTVEQQETTEATEAAE